MSQFYHHDITVWQSQGQSDICKHNSPHACSVRPGCTSLCPRWPLMLWMVLAWLQAARVCVYVWDCVCRRGWASAEDLCARAVTPAWKQPFCILFRAATAMTNTLKLHRQRHPDGATIEPVCKCLWVHLCECECVSSLSWMRPTRTVPHTNKRPFPGFQTRTGRQSGFSL